MLQLTNVSKSYEGRTVVAPLDLTIPPGQSLAIIGPSGCGKSTLIRLLIGLIPPDTGTVRFDGRDVAGADVREIRHQFGYVIQDGGLFPHLTARANIALLARHLGWNEPQVADRIETLRELTHLQADALDRYPRQISGGQQQRVSLMRALMLDPSVLLLDEPLGALDPLIRAGLQQDLRDIFASLGKTVVMVTHDINEAAYLADDMILLRDGVVVQRGSIEDLMQRPKDAFVTEFISAQHLVVGDAGR